MGILYSVCSKKRCKICGCNMDLKHEGDICECCLDDMTEIDEEVEYETLS